MKRSSPPRGSLFPRNSINAGWDLGGGGGGVDDPCLLSKPNVQAATAGRSLLGRPQLDHDSICIPDTLLLGTAFTASAADTLMYRVSTDLALKSCISSGGSSTSIMSRRKSKSSTNGYRSTAVADASKSANKNEEFNMARNVSFSHLQVREYEVTLGDNPSVTSGAPLSLGWRYNPQENVSSLDSIEADSMRRSRRALRLLYRERHRRLSANPNVSMEGLQAALKLVADKRFEPKESLHELREQMEKQRQVKHNALLVRSVMKRRKVGVHCSEKDQPTSPSMRRLGF